MYTLLDTFNDRIVSRHRTVAAAVKANAKLQRSVKRSNGMTSYLPVDLRLIDKDGELQRLPECSDQMKEWLYAGDQG